MVMKMFEDNKYDDDDDDNDNDDDNDDDDDDDDNDDDKDLSHLALEVVNMSSQHRVWGHIRLAWCHDSVQAWFG